MYEQELRDALTQEPFDLSKALTLSDKLHDAEKDGYEVSEEEDGLWEELTEQIELHRK
jgi:hypothetical protein